VIFDVVLIDLLLKMWISWMSNLFFRLSFIVGKVAVSDKIIELL